MAGRRATVGVSAPVAILINKDLNIKNVKGCRDGMPKLWKQGRDGIIVKVNLQSLLPASFSH